MTTYTTWFWHDEKHVRGPVVGSYSNRSAADAASESTEQGSDMHAMLRDAFGIQEVREDNCDPEVVVQGREEIGWNEESAKGDAQKYYDMLKKSEKPLHGGTKHSKLSAIVHLYSLKCVGRLSNKIFSDLLEFIIHLLPACDDTLAVNTYKAKKFLSDIGLRYEKIPGCRNDCMLFWKDNQELESHINYGESKWNDEIHLDEDGQPISPRKKRPVKILQWFPLIPQLQRLFMSEHTAPHMRCHVKGRTEDGVLRHPADGEV
jgi:hypothetical protein